MRAPDFWWHPAGAYAYGLAPVSAVYAAVAGARLGRAGARTPVPSICVGNFVAGGAGKTPTALAIACRLQELGRSPVFLTRGYGGRLRGPVQVARDRHTCDDVGDEALLLVQTAATVVARNRVAGAKLAATLGDVLVMDDGFQNPSLSKDLSILVIDGNQGIGNGWVIPAGPLRAPLALQASHADAVLAIGEGPGLKLAQSTGLPILRGELTPERRPDLRGQRVLAFCGIARPEKFLRSLAELGMVVVETRSFPDHYRYSDREARELLARAAKLGAATATTSKDAVRLTGSHALRTLAVTARIVRVRLVLQDEAALDELLMKALDRPPAP